MGYIIAKVDDSDGESLAQLRISAMKESLEFIGRFDPQRARNRFLEKFSKERTRKIMVEDKLAGFYVLNINADHLHIDHLYLHPDYQGYGFGGSILSLIKQRAKSEGLSIRLGALRESRSNDFYKKHGFRYTHEEEWDIYYEFIDDEVEP